MKYFHAFLAAATASFVFLILGGVIPNYRILSVIVSISPLVWYHIGYLSPRTARGLDRGAVDSVYYLGFLITLGSLAVAAFDIQTKTGQDAVNSLLAQFALGLLATAYALLARVHLQSTESAIDEEGASRVAADAARNWERVSASAELTLGSLGKAQAETQASNAKTLADIRHEQGAALRELALTYRDAMTAAVQDAAQAIKDVRDTAISADVAAANRDLAESLGGSVAAVKEINGAYAELSRRLGLASSVFEEAGRVAEGLVTHGLAEAEAHGGLATTLREASSAAAHLRTEINGLTATVEREASTLRTVDLAGTEQLTAQLTEREQRMLAALSSFDAVITEAAGQLAKSTSVLALLSSESSTAFEEAAKTASAAARIFVSGLEAAANNIVDATRARAIE